MFRLCMTPLLSVLLAMRLLASVGNAVIIILNQSSLFHILTPLTCLANNGIGAHLLKAGSKRRRTQAEMKDQYEME